MSFDAAPRPRLQPARPVVAHLALGTVLVLAAGFTSTRAHGADAGAAIQVIRDADTGELRAPTHEEHKSMQDRQRAARKAGAADDSRRGVLSGKMDPTPQRLSNGSRRVELNEKSMSYSVMTRNADGSLDMRCVTGANAAERLVQGGSVASTKASTQEAGHDHE